MTDGIIQKVISKYIHDNVMGYYNVELYNKMEIERLKDLQQELIEKIKQEFDNELTWEGYRPSDAHYLAVVENWKKALIGDNQE